MIGACLHSDLPLRGSALLLFGSLLEDYGGKWTLDAASDNKPLQAFVRISCGELRINLSSVLELANSDDPEPLEKLSNGVSVCVRVFLAVTKLLVQIMDDMDDDDGGGNADWSALPFDNLIHIKGR